MDIDGAILYFCISMPVTDGTVKYLQNDKANNTLSKSIIWIPKTAMIYKFFD